MKIIKYICKRDGYKIQTDPKTGRKKCVKMSQEERIKRKKNARKAAIKRKSHLVNIIKKMRKTKELNKYKNIQKIKKEIY